MKQGSLPERIGPYHLLAELGSGGFGSVWLASRADLGARRVALKVLHATDDPDQVARRFAAERGALDRMDHPGIARLLDAGRTDDGLPFLVMEHVPGTTLQDHARANGLSLRARLELFATVCDAVQHAHQHGVIHRDLSRGNVLVTEIDGRPCPKVIDFGIARAIGGAAGSGTLAGQALGTLAWMSPEQLQGDLAAIDVRTDVFALGVQLYELLTDQLPASPGPDLAAFQRQVLEEEPEPPSRRVLAQGPAGRRRAARLRGDLDAIAGKALRRDRAQRYGSAAELGADVRRHLQHLPVQARPPSRADRLQKLLRRHRGPLAAAAALAFTLLGGSLLFVALDREARAQARAAEQSGERSIAMAARAIAGEAQAQAQLRDFERLADLALLQELTAETATLWPELPGRVPDLRDWIGRALQLASRLDGHRAALAALRADAAPLAGRDQFLRDGLQALVTGLEQFTAPGGGALDEVRRRLQFAEQVMARTVEQPAAAWREVQTGLTADARFAGRQLAPQPGLIPLGRDPRSGLWEFAHLRTGSVPERIDGALQLRPDSALVLVLLPPGQALLGEAAPGAERPGGLPEGPQHTVALDWFFLGKHELTQAQWARVTGRQPSLYHQAPDGGPLHPVESVPWEDAERVLGQFDLELPTEAQWEYACRAGAGSPWSCGDDPLELARHANFADRTASLAGMGWPSLLDPPHARDPFVRHGPIGQLLPNAFGLHDMHGNVAEYCRDHALPYAVPARAGDGLRARTGDEAPGGGRIVRGGSYYTAPWALRCAARQQAQPGVGLADRGVRAARAVRP